MDSCITKEQTISQFNFTKKIWCKFFTCIQQTTIPKKKGNIQTAQTNVLTELPFNQFKYDKDILDATKLFFKDQTNRQTELVLKQLPNAVGLY